MPTSLGDFSEGTPTVTGILAGSAETVFETKDACELIDIPDSPARAFRDANGMVHLIATHYVARAMVGPSLDELTRDCRVIYRSPDDRDPSHYQEYNWLTSLYTVDGKRIAALVHSEYHADEVAGFCATPKKKVNCWWNTVTFAESADGGYSFSEPTPPLNLVASLPYRYTVGNLAGAYGYSGPLNILKIGNFYYAMVNDWPFKLQKYGPCLLRTTDVFDPKSWRAWDGKGFAIRFVDPYREKDFKPEEHVCEPVRPGNVDSVVQLSGTNIFLVSEFTPDSRYGPPGLYLAVSHNLIHWSKPILIAKTDDMLKDEAPGHWSYSYFSLLDPKSPDRNFSTISTTPYVYYVRFDLDHPPYSRALVRRRINLSVV